MSTHPCAFCGLDQEIPAGRHDHAQLCITALRAALAMAESRSAGFLAELEIALAKRQ